MEPTNIHMLYHADFLDTKPLLNKPHTYKSLWWGLALIETMLVFRFVFEYFNTQITNGFILIVYTFTDFISYPFTLSLQLMSTNSVYSWLPIIVAINGYFLLTITLVKLLKLKRSPYARLERARALSRRRYSY